MSIQYFYLQRRRATQKAALSTQASFPSNSVTLDNSSQYAKKVHLDDSNSSLLAANYDHVFNGQTPLFSESRASA